MIHQQDRDQPRRLRGWKGRVAQLGVTAVLALGLGAGGVLTSQAIPPDGAGPESPGTSSRVWPTTVQPGDRLYFEVSGYPANETVYIKIDDGLACSDTSHGACVYHTQALNSNGYATGSIVVPELAPGAHWLRMLATGDVFDEVTGERIGYEGYTRRGGNDFTVVSAGGSDSGTGGSSSSGNSSSGGSADSSTTGGSGSEAGGGVSNSDGSIAGGSINLDVEEAEETEEATGDELEETMDDITVATSGLDEDTAVTDESVPDTAAAVSGSDFPVLGVGVLSGAVLIGGGLLGWTYLRQRRGAAALVTDGE